MSSFSLDHAQWTCFTTVRVVHSHYPQSLIVCCILSQAFAVLCVQGLIAHVANAGKWTALACQAILICIPILRSLPASQDRYIYDGEHCMLLVPCLLDYSTDIHYRPVSNDKHAIR